MFSVIELTLGPAPIEGGTFFYSIRYMNYMKFFEWQDMELVIFRASLVVKKYSLFDPLGEK